ncbi:PAS domain S-box protein [Edaphobacter sp. HDX4]|uniref:two-component system sensor histidine kinase NtrB n=1 Tax=Edaphobacter sp. HDX4 TaxID=2794064 RepID=UPI002FE552BA
MNRRLVESASVHLDLVPVMLTGQRLEPSALADLEMIVIDVDRLEEIRSLISSRGEDLSDGVLPAVILATLPDDPSAQGTDSFDAVLAFPMTPAQISAQLSVILLAHRAFARRYHSALEELHLNRRIFRSVTSGISVASATRPDLPLIYVNPAFEVMTGYRLEEIAGLNCRFLQGEERDQPALTVLREAILAEREVVVILKNFRKDGTFFWNELSLSPIRNRDGELTHFVGIQTDVTARVEFEAALRESEKLAAVGRLASSIAHEINNPLESIVNLVYLAQRSDNLLEARNYLQTADRELQRVKLITSQSLRFYKQSTKPQAINLSDLIDSVLDVYSARLSARGVTIERRERTTQSIVCMESEIRQVLNNLVSNAMDALRGHHGRLLIRTREATEWRSNVKGIAISVSDTGSGIDPSEIQSIYKAFYTTKGLRGTGLGLWISSEIVDRHQGRLLVRSSQRESRSGTTFTLFLPFQALPS